MIDYGKERTLMDVDSLCPNISGWMNHASAVHPLRELIASAKGSDEPESVSMRILIAFENITSALEDAQPDRLPTERRDFQNARTWDDLLIVRAELVAAAKLASAAVPFDFGARGEIPLPDLILKNDNLGIEVKARRLDGLRDLHDELEAALDETDADVTVHIECQERPLYVKPPERREIINQTLQRITSGAGGTVSAMLDQPWAITKQLPLAIQIFPHPPFASGQRVFIQGGWSLAGHLGDIESEVIAVLTDEQKVSQAESMPTILLVDVGRAGLAWIRPERIWAQMLAARLPDDTSFIGVATMVQRLDAATVAIALALHESALDPDKAAVRNLAQALGLTEQGNTWYG